jgi:hypothetical protein
MARSPYLTQGKRLKNSVANAVIQLHQEGFSYDFSMLENHSYLCLQSNKVYTHDTANITFVDEFYDRYTSNYKFIHTIDTCCGIKGLMILNTMYNNEINKHTENLPMRHSLKERLDPVTYNLIIDLFDKRSRLEDRLLVRYKDKILPIAFNDIAFFYLENELTKLVTFEKKTYIIQKNLDELEKQAGVIFFRANRQYLINKLAIKDLSTSLTRSMTVNLNIEFPTKIDVSKNKAGYFLEWLSLYP